MGTEPLLRRHSIPCSPDPRPARSTLATLATRHLTPHECGYRLTEQYEVQYGMGIARPCLLPCCLPTRFVNPSTVRSGVNS